jgi:hypothetical protein
MSTTSRIAVLQNSTRSLALLKAIAVTHRHAQRAQAISLAMSAVVASLSLLTQQVSATTSAVVVTGVLWAVFYAVVVVPWSGRYLELSATLQEMFDVELYGMPWNLIAIGNPVPEDEVSRLSRRFTGDEARLHDYYLVADVPEPYDVLFCLEQNLAWGSRVRRRYADLLVALVTLWFVASVVAGIASGVTVAGLVSNWFIPSLGLLLLCLDIYRAQVSITRERDRVLAVLRVATGDDPGTPAIPAGPAATEFARRVQDALFELRRRQPRVPTWFFRRFHDSDMADFRFKMHSLESRVGVATDATS